MRNGIILLNGRIMNSQITNLGVNEGNVDIPEFFESVALNAYYRAEKRGFEPGHDVEDWLAAEHEIKQQRRYWSL